MQDSHREQEGVAARRRSPWYLSGSAAVHQQDLYRATGRVGIFLNKLVDA